MNEHDASVYWNDHVVDFTHLYLHSMLRVGANGKHYWAEGMKRRSMN